MLVSNFYITNALNDNVAISALGVGTGDQYGVYMVNGKIAGAKNGGIHVGGVLTTYNLQISN